MGPQEALETVKYLVEQCGASVVLRDAAGRTPYDVGSSQAVKGYLLPRQLQQETVEEQANNPVVVAPPPPMGGTPVQAQPQPSSNYADPLEALMRPPNSAPPGGFGSPMPMGSPMMGHPPPGNMVPPPTMAMPMGSPMMGHPGGAQQQQQCNGRASDSCSGPAGPCGFGDRAIPPRRSADRPRTSPCGDADADAAARRGRCGERAAYTGERPAGAADKRRPAASKFGLRLPSFRLCP